jgi:hypothetical protein
MASPERKVVIEAVDGVDTATVTGTAMALREEKATEWSTFTALAEWSGDPYPVTEIQANLNGRYGSLTARGFAAPTSIYSTADAERFISGGLANVNYMSGGVYTATGSTLFTLKDGDSISLNLLEFKTWTSLPVIDVTGGTVDIELVGVTFTPGKTPYGATSGPILKVSGGSAVVNLTATGCVFGTNTIQSVSGSTIQFTNSGSTVGAHAGLAGTFSQSETGDYTVKSISSADSPYVCSPDDDTVLVDSSSGTVTIKLPAVLAGKRVTVKDSGGSSSTNNITVQASGGETIDATSSFTFDINRSAASFVSDGSNWFVW